MEKDFAEIYSRYERKGGNLEEIRIFFLNNRASNEFLSNVDKLMLIAINKGDRVAEAFFHAVKFWKLCGYNLPEAKHENNAALNIYYTLTDYENAFGYLSVVNNFLLAATLEGDVNEAYTYVQRGLRLTKNNYDDFHIAFVNNYIYLLNEAGLYAKALKLAEDNLLLKNIMMKKQQCLSEYVFVNELILVGRYADAKKSLSAVASRYKSIKKYFDYRLFVSENLRLSVAEKDAASAEKYYNEVSSIFDLNGKIQSSDEAEAYLDVAAYYNFIGDEDKAYEYYKICYVNKNRFFGKKMKILRPLVNLAAKRGAEEYERYEEELTEFTERCADVTEKINMSYDDAALAPYVDLTEFEENVKKIRNLYTLKEYVVKTVKELFNAQYVNISYRNNAKGYFTFERTNATKVFTLSEVHILESFGDYPVSPADLPFKVDSDCRAAYIYKIGKAKAHAFMFIGYDEENAYTHGVNKVALERITEILSDGLEYLYDANQALCAANRDFLTRLNNRYAFYEFATDKKAAWQDLYIVVFKIDNIDEINAVGGYDAGNSVCVNFAGLLAEHFPDKYAFKYDAHTFVGFMQTDGESLENLLEDLLSDVRLSVAVCGNRQIKYTVSAGAAFVLNIDCFDNAFNAAWDRLNIAAKKGDSYVLYIDRNMQIESTRYLINVREYLKIDNSPFFLTLTKEDLIAALKKVYDRERALMLDDNAIIQDTYTKYAKGEADLTLDGFKVLKEFTRNLSSTTKNFDTTLAYSIHLLLYDFVRKNDMLNETVEEIYYIGLTAWQLSSFGVKSPVTEELINEYKGRFDELDDTGKTFFIRAYGNLTLQYTNGDIYAMRSILEGFLAFLDEVEDNYNLDFNFRASRLSVYLNGYTCINYLTTYEEEKTDDNVDFIYQCAYRAMNLIDSVGATYSSKTNVEYVYRVASFYKGLISTEELTEYLRAHTVYAENASYAEKYWAIMWFGIRYLKRLYDDGKGKTKEFYDKIEEILHFIKTEGLKNIGTYVDRNILDFITEFCAVLPAEDVKKILTEITVSRHASTVIHVYGVTEIYCIILEYMLDHTPEYFVGILDGFTLDDVKNRKNEIKAIGRDMALMHDIGKHSIIKIINNSSRRLFDLEFFALKTHVTYGYKMIKNMNFNQAIKDGVLFHHKWYNNEGGYPSEKNTSCNKPLVDILSVADSIDAATDKYGRSYAYAKTLQNLIDEFNCFKDTRYSAAVIEALEVPEVFDKVNDFIENKRVDMIYDVYRKYETE